MAQPSSEAYESPNFATELFSADGIFLPDDERSSLLEALAAIASNFPESSSVDDDLREKALAIALHLNPMHMHSRLAHRELLIGASPKPTSFFTDNLSTVSETLWVAGKRMLTPPLNPEEKRLAPYLLELSLLIHPAPPPERLLEFAVACDKQQPNWDPTVTAALVPKLSTTRAVTMFREALDLLAERENGEDEDMENRPQMGMAAQASPNPKRPNGGPRPSNTAAEAPPFETIQAALATLLWVESSQARLAEIDRFVSGELTLSIRQATRPVERNFLAEAAANEIAIPLTPPIPLGDSIPPLSLDIPSQALEERGWSWPAGTLGEVAFHPDSPLPGPQRLFRADSLFPSLVLIDILLHEGSINPSFVLAGGIDPETLKATSPEDPLAMIEAGGKADRPYLLIPESALEPIILYLQQSEHLELLMEKELIAYRNLNEAIQRLSSPNDSGLIEASKIFDEIKAAATRMPLPDLARLPSAQAKLESLLASCPEHFSARAMLEYGTRPVPPEIRLSLFVKKIDEIVAPALGLEEATITDPLAERIVPFLDAESSALLDEKSSTFFPKLRTETLPETRELLSSAEDLVKAAQLYQQTTNKSSSTGTQRLRDARAAIAAFKEAKAKLGFETEDDDPE